MNTSKCEVILYVFLSLPGSLVIDGLEEAGWMYILKPELDKEYGFVLSSIFTGTIWIFWHIPLFLFQALIMEGDSLTFGCLQFNSWPFGFLMEQFTKYQEKDACSCVSYFIPCLM